MPSVPNPKSLAGFAGLAVVVTLLAGLSAPVPSASTPAAAEKRGSDVQRARSVLDEAEVALAARRFDDAADLFRQAFDIAQARSHPNLPLARAIDGMADVQRHRRRFAEAEQFYLRSIEMWVALLGEKQPRLATTLHNLGTVYIEMGRPADAEPHLSRALAIWDSTLGPDSPEAENTRRALARL